MAITTKSAIAVFCTTESIVIGAEERSPVVGVPVPQVLGSPCA